MPRNEKLRVKGLLQHLAPGSSQESPPGVVADLFPFNFAKAGCTELNISSCPKGQLLAPTPGPSARFPEAPIVPSSVWNLRRYSRPRQALGNTSYDLPQQRSGEQDHSLPLTCPNLDSAPTCGRVSLVATGYPYWQSIPTPWGYTWAPAAKMHPPRKDPVTMETLLSLQCGVKEPARTEVDLGLHPVLNNQAETPRVSVQYPSGHSRAPGPRPCPEDQPVCVRRLATEREAAPCFSDRVPLYIWGGGAGYLHSKILVKGVAGVEGGEFPFPLCSQGHVATLGVGWILSLP